MFYTARNFDLLLGLPGFSDTLLKNHFTLYGGYVANINKLTENLAALAEAGKTGTPEFAELTRRFGWEWNGMRLHELYFGNLTKNFTPLASNSALAQKIVAEFGSLANWEKEFRAIAALRGIGWVILYADRESGKLTNVWINEHDGGHLADATPLLVLDVFEHAFMLDYGLKRADYIEAFVRTVDWGAVVERLKNA